VWIRVAEGFECLFRHRALAVGRAPNAEDLDGGTREADAVAAVSIERDGAAECAPCCARFREVPVAAAERGQQGCFVFVRGIAGADDGEAGFVFADSVGPERGFGCALCVAAMFSRGLGI